MARRRRPRSILNEAEGARGEGSKVRQNGRKRGRVRAKPSGERGRVLIDGNGRQPATQRPLIARAARRQGGHRAVYLAAADCAADNQVMASPCMIGSPAGIWPEGPREIGDRERCHVIAGADVRHRALERRECRVQLREKRLLCVYLIGVSVPYAS